IKPSGDKFIIKSEKITRPARLENLQIALEIFRDEFTQELITNSINAKKSKFKKSQIVKDELEAINFLNNSSKKAIEIGFGSGRHLLYRAKENHEISYLGIEIYKPSIDQVENLAIKDKLLNLALLNCDARSFLSLVKSNSIDFIYLHFPVPWDDSEHRRVISKSFLEEAKRVLKVGGRFELRSDSRNYSEFSINKMLDLNGVSLEIYKNKNLEISSKYEDRWKKQDKDIYDIIMINNDLSDDISNFKELEFPKFDSFKIASNFKHEKFKFDDYFINFEEIYKFSDDEILLKLSFGDFSVNENRFIYISKEVSKYYINSPLPTKINQKAHEKIKEILLK
ncbi:tRNA (guanosine(46)-N7)-methyltransferase TrmB, partial [Campylobacter ureolyticus]|uniref:tRNA (guanosine(46)-N7)-methyltransferase TrmB n=1 Tax=Campylobacter ureolyticus TaxID=827 RepID=UPI00290FC838